MKTTKTSARRAALIAVLVLGSSTWLSAQNNQGRIGQSASGRLDSNGNVVYAPRSTAGSQESDAPDAPVAFQQDGFAGAPGTISQSAQPLKINKGSSLIGTTVKNQQGENLGKITDLVIDYNSDRVSYLVLDSGSGILNKQKLHAVPLRAFQPDPTGTSLILNAEKDKIESSAGFSNENWPAVGTSTWGAEPFWKDTKGADDSLERRALDQQHIQNEIHRDYRDATIEQKKINAEPLPRQ